MRDYWLCVEKDRRRRALREELRAAKAAAYLSRFRKAVAIVKRHYPELLDRPEA
jgi:hypothetical protein